MKPSWNTSIAFLHYIKRNNKTSLMHHLIFIDASWMEWTSKHPWSIVEESWIHSWSIPWTWLKWILTPFMTSWTWFILVKERPSSESIPWFIQCSSVHCCSRIDHKSKNHFTQKKQNSSSCFWGCWGLWHLRLNFENSTSKFFMKLWNVGFCYQ